jgi:hypothetical protein
MKFVLVSGRTPRLKSFCLECCEQEKPPSCASKIVRGHRQDSFTAI